MCGKYFERKHRIEKHMQKKHKHILVPDRRYQDSRNLLQNPKVPAFITVLFTCFLNVIVYFISISEFFVTIISPELCVLNLDKFFQPTLDCKNTQAYTFS